MGLRDLLGFLWPGRRVKQSARPATRGPITHVVILDGTMSTLRPRHETNAGITYKLLAKEGPRAHLSLHYEPGIPIDAVTTFT